MDASDLLRIRIGAEPSGRVDGLQRPDPREVDRLCAELGWPEAYCVRWVTYAAGLPDNDPDGRPLGWSLRQLRALLLIRGLYHDGRLNP